MLCINCEQKELIGKQTMYCGRTCERRGWKRNNKAKNVLQNKKFIYKQQVDKRAYVSKLKEAPCTDCGDCYPPYVMQFDHVRGDKKLAVSMMVRYGWQTLKAEIDKCELVCSNCHAERTHQRRLLLKNV